MKLTKLLPIITLSGIATIAAPLATSCSNGSKTVDTIVLDEKYADDYLRTKDQMVFKKDTKYKAHFETSKLQGAELEGNWFFIICESLEFDPSKCSVFSTDGAMLWFNTNEYHLGEPKTMFFIDNDFQGEGISAMCGSKGSQISSTDDITIEFQVKDDTAKSYLIFGTWG